MTNITYASIDFIYDRFMSYNDPELATTPSSGAYSVAVQEYLINESGWIDNQLSVMRKSNSDLASQIIRLANITETMNYPSSKAIFLASCLLIDALARDKTGALMDQKFKV